MQALSFAELPLPAQYRPTDWGIGGLGLVYLAWQSVAYPCLAAAIDALRDLPCADASHRKTPGPGASASALTGAAALPDAGQRDEDVAAEDRRVASGAADASSAVLVKNIKKVPAPARAAGPCPCHFLSCCQ